MMDGITLKQLCMSLVGRSDNIGGGQDPLKVEKISIEEALKGFPNSFFYNTIKFNFKILEL
jgi:hypothetical protein